MGGLYPLPVKNLEDVAALLKIVGFIGIGVFRRRPIPYSPLINRVQ